MIKNLFPIKIYETEFPNYENIKLSLVNEILSFYDLKSNFDNFNHYPSGDADHNLHEILKCREIIDFINYNLKIYWKELDYTEKYEPEITVMASNYIPAKTGSMFRHVHHQDVVAVFYVDVPEDSSPIVFYNPLEPVLSRLPYYEKDSGKYFQCNITPKSGKLILFPGFLSHSVEQNNTDKHRISLVADCGTRVKD
jgi:uncharacterized protein (TIGR02466 family)